MARNLREHSKLVQEDVEQITKLSYVVRQYEANDDLIRQGDRPKAAVLVLSGMVGRYHLLGNGRRQYLSFHIIGDMPDAQGYSSIKSTTQYAQWVAPSLPSFRTVTW